MKPFFSIIIPTYNRSNHILKALDSVKKQKFENWECLIIDDGSTDDTQKVVRDYIKKDKRFQYHFQNNAERCVARNNGIEKSKGENICFLDSDDYYLDHHLSSFYNKIQEKKIIGIYITNTIKKSVSDYKKSELDDNNKYLNNVCFILEGKESIIPSRVAISKRILVENKFNETVNISEDTELFARIACKHPLILLKTHSVVYNIHEGNSINLSKNPFLGQLKSMEILFSNLEIKKLVPQKTINTKLSLTYYGISNYHFLVGNYFQMLLNLIKSIFYNPKGKLNKRNLYMLLSPLLRKKRKQ